MSKQNAPKCPRCGSDDRYHYIRHPDDHGCSPDGDFDNWHREPAAPPEGETVHFPIDKTDAYDERVDRERQKAVASPAPPCKIVDVFDENEVLRAEVARRRIAMGVLAIQCEKAEADLARLREQVRQTTKAIIESERAALESTTPQGGQEGKK